MPESPTTPGRSDICNSEPDHIALRFANCVGTRIYCTFVAQWLAYALPYRRFASTLGLDFTKKVRQSMRELQNDARKIIPCRKPCWLENIELRAKKTIKWGLSQKSVMPA